MNYVLKFPHVWSLRDFKNTRKRWFAFIKSDGVFILDQSCKLKKLTKLKVQVTTNRCNYPVKNALFIFFLSLYNLLPVFVFLYMAMASWEFHLMNYCKNVSKLNFFYRKPVKWLIFQLLKYFNELIWRTFLCSKICSRYVKYFNLQTQNIKTFESKYVT